MLFGRHIEMSDDCYELIELKKGLWKVTMWGTVEIYDCNGQIEIYPATQTLMAIATISENPTTCTNSSSAEVHTEGSH